MTGSPMTDRERFVACVLGEPVDRPPYWLFWGPWATTWERWTREGKPSAVTDHRSLFGPDQPPLALPVNTGPCPRFDPVVFEETPEFVIHLDSWGIKRRDFRHRESMSEFLEFPVLDWPTWEEFKRERLNPNDPARLAGDWRKLGAEWMNRGYPIQLGDFPDAGIFGPVRWLLGDEEGLVAFHTAPDLVHDIMNHMTTLYLTVFEQVVREIRVDVIHLWEDMCFRSGPLISPRHWMEFMGPHYRRIRRFADEHGIPVVSVDTDGNPSMIASHMVDCGVNLLFPMEVAADCDVNVWRAQRPTLALMGGIDKRVLARGRADIDRELERIRPAIAQGRYIPDLDHLIPDDVSWTNYYYYASRLKDIVGAV
ncbi:MAG: hypothetical protein GX620_05960 [Chloroflexi bacterium]|nr:hypothetical protein [Chloroflexota bacterium]